MPQCHYKRITESTREWWVASLTGKSKNSIVVYCTVVCRSTKSTVQYIQYPVTFMVQYCAYSIRIYSNYYSIVIYLLLFSDEDLIIKP